MHVRPEEIGAAGLTVINPGRNIIGILKINLLTGTSTTGPLRFIAGDPRAQVTILVRLKVVTAQRSLKQITEVKFQFRRSA